MAYYITDPRLGMPGSTVLSDSSAPAVPAGTIAHGVDPVYGGGEFVYLPCVSGQVVGNLVNYTSGSGQTVGTNVYTTLNPNTANLARPVAVAMVANTSGVSKYGWFCIQGTVPVKKTAVRVSPNVAVFQSATAGRIMPTVASGKQVLAARTMNTATVLSATSTVLVEIMRPHMQGQVI